MKRKVFFAILSRYLWPIDGGRKESLNHYFKELYDNYGYDIYLMCFLEYGQSVKNDEIPYYINSVTALNDVNSSEKLKNVLLMSLGKRQLPFQCALYYSKENAELIQKYVRDLKPDVIFTEMIRVCAYYDVLKNSKAMLLANLDDLLSDRYMRQRDSLNSKANFEGAYSGKLPSFLSKVINSKSVKKQILGMEAKRCALWEKKYYELYDYVLMTSDVERDKLNQSMVSNKAKTLSVGIDYDYYSQPVAVEKNPIGLVYHGNFNVAANADTLEMVVNEILPLIKHDFHFYIVGKCPEQIMTKYEKDERIEFCGRVDDLREYIERAAVYLAPIAYGTGVKTKIVEAMAMHMPVITNSVGAEGIYGEPGRDYIVCDESTEIAKAVNLLLDDRVLAGEIGENAAKFAYNNFRWDKVLSVYREIGL